MCEKEIKITEIAWETDQNTQKISKWFRQRPCGQILGDLACPDASWRELCQVVPLDDTCVPLVHQECFYTLGYHVRVLCIIEHTKDGEYE